LRLNLAVTEVPEDGSCFGIGSESVDTNNMEITLYKSASPTNDSTSLTQALLYCSLASVGFVGSLYAFVPSKVNLLERNDALQIKWRSASGSIACIAALTAFPLFFGAMVPYQAHVSTLLSDEIRACAGVLLNSSLLFLGPIAVSMMNVYDYLQRNQSQTMATFLQAYHDFYLRPIGNGILRPAGNERWIYLRNLVFAPLTEEIVFRGSIVSALARTTLSTGSIVIIAPLFFGSAHIHHALVKLRQGDSPMTVAIQTAVQFAYTSLFGSYASFAYLRSRSILAVTLSHSFCNAMGLPNLQFVRKGGHLHSYRMWLLAAHVGGVVAFGLTIERLLPLHKAGK